MLSILIFSGLLQAADIPYADQDFGCIAQANANKYISDFKVDLESFGGAEFCNSKVDTKKLLNDILIVEQGQFTSSGQNNLIKGFVDPKNYYTWLASQTYGVSRGNDVPYATAYNRGGYFTMQDGWAKLSTLGRVGTFIHEARHTEGYRHIACNQGPYQGANLAGCDSNYNYGGSHAVEMEYYAHVSVQGTNFHPVYKKMARLMAIARSNFVFNTSPIQIREGLMALSADRKQVDMLDNGKWYVRETPEVDGRLKRTSFGAVLFDGMKAFAIEAYLNSGFKDLVVDTYSYYKLILEKAQTVKDFEEFDSGIKRYVVKISQDDYLSAYDFPNGDWGRAQKVPIVVQKTTTAIPGNAKSGLFIVGTNGQVYNYQPETQRLISQSNTWDSKNLEVVNFKGQNLILKDDNKIYIQTSSGAQPWTATNKSYAGLVTIPLYDAFEVVKE